MKNEWWMTCFVGSSLISFGSGRLQENQKRWRDGGSIWHSIGMHGIACFDMHNKNNVLSFHTSHLLRTFASLSLSALWLITFSHAQINLDINSTLWFLTFSHARTYQQRLPHHHQHQHYPRSLAKVDFFIVSAALHLPISSPVVASSLSGEAGYSERVCETGLEGSGVW